MGKERTFDSYNEAHAQNRANFHAMNRSPEQAADFDVSIETFIHPADLPDKINGDPVDRTKVYLLCRPLFENNGMPDVRNRPFLFDAPSGVASGLYGTEYQNKIATLRFPNFPTLDGAYISSIRGTLGDEASSYCKKQTAWNIGMTAGI